MSLNKRIITAFALSTLGVFLMALALTMPVQAAPALDDGSSSSCSSCHVDRYWLFDEGKWYCVCAKRVDRCTACHLGDQSAYDEDVAHTGLVANPLVDTETYCGQCHPHDYQQRVDQFVEMTGAQPPAEKVQPVYHPAAPETTQHEKILVTREARAPWQLVAGLVVIVVTIVVAAGICIWTCVVKKPRTG